MDDYVKPPITAHQHFLDFKLQQEIASLEFWLEDRRNSSSNRESPLCATLEGLISTRKRLLRSLS